MVKTAKILAEHVLGTYCCKTKQITTTKPNIIEKYLQRGKHYIRPENYTFTWICSSWIYLYFNWLFTKKEIS